MERTNSTRVTPHIYLKYLTRHPKEEQREEERLTLRDQNVSCTAHFLPTLPVIVTSHLTITRSVIGHFEVLSMYYHFLVLRFRTVLFANIYIVFVRFYSESDNGTI